MMEIGLTGSSLHIAATLALEGRACESALKVGAAVARAARIASLLTGFLFCSAVFVTAAADDKHAGPVVDFAHVGPVLHSVSQGGVFAHEGDRVRLIHKPEFRVFGMAAVPGGELKGESLLLVGGVPGESGSVAWLNLHSGRSKLLNVAEDVVYDVAVRSDGREAALACADKRVLTMELKGFAMMPPALRHKHTSDARAAAYSPDGQWLASGGLDGVVLLSSRAKRTEPKVLQEHTAGVESLAFSPDGRHLASGSRDARVRLHTADGGFVRTYSGLGMELMKSGLGKKPYIWALAWGGRDDELIAGASRGTLYRLSQVDATWGKLDWKSERAIYSLAFDGSGGLAVGSESVFRLNSKLK